MLLAAPLRVLSPLPPPPPPPPPPSIRDTLALSSQFSPEGAAGRLGACLKPRWYGLLPTVEPDPELFE